MNPTLSSLRPLLYATDPYRGFDPAPYPMDLQGWGSEHPIFRKVLAEVRPSRIYEVGTWKGASAIHMARCIKELGLNAEILCIDTWLGAAEFWNDHQDPERYLSLRIRHGYPSVFYQFLANVLHSGFDQTITPFPQTSQIAARWLRSRSLQADVIYIDGSHEEEDVLADLHSYWALVRPGGLLFGDDYNEYWPGVISAVRRFATGHGIAVDAFDEKWVLHKPLEWKNSEDGRDSPSQIVATATRFEVISEQLVQVVRRLNALESHPHLREQTLARLYTRAEQSYSGRALLRLLLGKRPSGEDRQ